MADGGSSQHSSKTEDDYDFSASTSLSSKASKEMLLSNPSLEIEVRPYRFEPGLPDSTDRNIEGRARCTDVFESVIVDCVGNTEW